MGYASVVEAINTHPVSTAGKAMGDGTWRFCVQMLTPGGGARVGTAIVGTSTVSDYVWTDLTNDVTGEITWTRGQGMVTNGLFRADVGTASFTLDNSDSAYSCWNTDNTLYREYTVGAVIRVVVFKPTASSSYFIDADGGTWPTRTDWEPQFTGLVESWDEVFTANGAYVNVNLAETFSYLAGVNKAAQSSQGAGEAIIDRLVRLLNDANWLFGITYTSSCYGTYNQAPTQPAYYGDVRFQATTMASNRLADIYLTSDSGYYVPIISGRDGAARWGLPVVFPQDIVSSATCYYFTSALQATAADRAAYSGIVTAYYEPPLLVTNNSDAVVGEARMTRVGGTQQTYTNTTSSSRFRPGGLERNDLICDDDADALLTATYVVNRFAGVSSTAPYNATDQTLQPGEVTVTNQFAAQRALDLYDFVCVDWTNYNRNATTAVIQFACHVTSMTHTIENLAQGVNWTTTYTFFAISNRER